METQIDVSRLIRRATDDPEWTNILDPQTGRNINVPNQYLTDVYLMLEGRTEQIPTDAPSGAMLVVLFVMVYGVDEDEARLMASDGDGGITVTDAVN